VISWRAGQVRTASIDGSQYSSSIPPPTPPLTSRRRPATLTVLRILPTTNVVVNLGYSAKTKIE